MKWDRRRIDPEVCEACAELWGLEEPIYFDFGTSSPIVEDYQVPSAYGYPEGTLVCRLPRGFCVYAKNTVWLCDELVLTGQTTSRRVPGPIYALRAYTHECAHRIAYLAGGNYFASHRLTFAALYVFLLHRLPADARGGDSIAEWLVDYDHHETLWTRETRAGRSKRLPPEKRQEKAEKEIRRLALKWGRQLAKNKNLTAPDAASILIDRFTARIDRMDRFDEEILPGIGIGLMLVVIMVAAWLLIARELFPLHFF